MNRETRRMLDKAASAAQNAPLNVAPQQPQGKTITIKTPEGEIVLPVDEAPLWFLSRILDILAATYNLLQGGLPAEVREEEDPDDTVADWENEGGSLESGDHFEHGGEG